MAPSTPTAPLATPHHRRFATSDVDKARQTFSDLYAEATIERLRSIPFDCVLDVIACGPITVVSGSWRGAWRAVMPSIGDQYILTLSDDGVAHGEHAGERHSIAPGRHGVVGSFDRPATVTTEARYEGRSITIDRAAVEDHFIAITGQAPRESIVFESALEFERNRSAALLRATRHFRHEVAQPGVSSILLASLRDMLLTALLIDQPHSAVDLLGRPALRVAPARVRRAEEYMEAHASEPITLADLTAAAGAPARSLQASFKAFRGVTPMEALAQRRLELARQRLLSPAPGTTVLGVVKDLGFSDAGRFSAAYKKRFGVSPSESLARGRAAVAYHRVA